MLRHGHHEPNRFFRWFNGWFARVTGHYVDGVVWMIRRARSGAAVYAGMVGVTVCLWRTTPGSLVPDEDQGFYISAIILPDGATLERTDRVVEQVEAADAQQSRQSRTWWRSPDSTSSAADSGTTRRRSS